jgi:hypothetical protein
MPATASIVLELLKAALSLALLLAGWLVGQRIVATWDLRKKRQELDVVAAVQFQNLYGDLKEVARLWREYRLDAGGAMAAPSDTRWTLLRRAAAAESRYEAVVIKLASERRSNPEQRATLGLFRQACQRLREGIRHGEDVGYAHFSPEYRLFNDLAAEVTCLIGDAADRGHRLSPAEARSNLEQIAKVRSEDWQARAADYPTGPESAVG